MTPPTDDGPPNARLGVIAGLLAYTFWGIFPVYFKLVDTVAPLEVLLHRVVWAVPFGALIILFRRQIGQVARAFRSPGTLLWLALAAVCIAGNWFVYIWAVMHERIFETSLGYYINPLVYVLVGVAFFGERLRRLQLAAVALATVGVSILTVSGGQLPWVSLSLAALFTAYGVIRKQVWIGAMPGLFVETLLLFPLAAGGLGWLMASGSAAFGTSAAPLTALLLLAGPVTVLPLLFFATAARNLTLTTVGFMQFIAPTLQFMTAVWYGEALTTARLACFACIWVAVLVFSADAISASAGRRTRSVPGGGDSDPGPG
ncbi:MAG TPA: EamA family transporter RarD [Woeseiaceae bacterium]|nr:EamA family transporter RarD [Woeseiaceae bacterium]